MEVGWVFIIILFLVIFIFFIISNQPKMTKKMYTKYGYPRADIVALNFNGVPQGLDIIMSCTPDKLIFEGNGVCKEILHENVADITLQTVDNNTDISKFSYGKAIAGMVVFGTIGAIAGISGKKKQDLEMLVISYIENDDFEYITFLQQTKKEYPINTEAFYLKQAIERIEEVRKGNYIPFKLK